MRWRKSITCAIAVFSLFAFTSAQEEKAFICDPSKPFQGCSEFGRCDVPTLSCKCNPGFMGDGKTCESICSTANQTCKAMPEAASCIDLPISSTSHACVCKEGYEWSQTGMHCYDIDECQVRSCKPFANCKNLPGNYSCECCYSREGWKGISGFGYFGDGKTRCYPDSILEYGHSDYMHHITEKKGVIHSTFPGGFPFFGELYHDVYVHLDGYVTFGTKDAPYLGGDAFPTHRYVKFVAPFWTDLEVSSEPGSGLYVDGYSMFSPYDGRSPIESLFPNKLRGFIDEINLPGFYPTVMYVATWANMTASGKLAPKQNARITFQIAMATNGTHSFGFTSYAEHPRDTEWDAPLDNVYIGLARENSASRHPVNRIEELFDDPHPGTTGCEKLTFLTQRGRKYAVFGPPFVQSNSSKCLAEASRQGQKHQGFDVESEDKDGHMLPPELFCPCLEQQVQVDDRFAEVHFEKAPIYNPPVVDRHSCHMSRFYKTIDTPSKTYRARAYCCYDHQGALVTKGRGAGAIVPEGHEQEAVELKTTCCVNADLCDVFQRMYRPVTCHRYERPAMAYIRGAGHFDVLKGTKYSFNGRGEFTFIDVKRQAATIQIRMEELDFPHDRKTSFVSGVALRCHVPPQPTSPIGDWVEHVAEVRLNKTSSTYELVVDGGVANSTFPEEVKTTFITGCTAQYCEIICKYQSYVLALRAELFASHLHIEATLPRLGELSPLGLIGSSTGELKFGKEVPDPSQPDQTMLIESQVTDLTNDTQLHEFGEYYRVDVNASLFSYVDDESWDTYNKDGQSFVPTYWSDLPFNYEEMKDICHCEGDRGCQYDQLVTGNRTTSTETFIAGRKIGFNRMAFETRTPQWDTDSYIGLDIHFKLSGNARDAVTHDEMYDHLNNTDPMVPDGFKVMTNLDHKLYDFFEDTGDYIIYTDKYPETWRYNSYYIHIYTYKMAKDGLYALSLYKPDIYVCACDKADQCDFSYITNRTSAFRSTNSENYHLLPCNCPPDASNRFCLGKIDVCAAEPCGLHGECTIDHTAPEGYTCECSRGYTGNGFICKLNDCPSNSGCDQLCTLDPFTIKPICSCKDGYVLNDDYKTCRDRNECNFPNSCPDAKSICHNTIGSYYCECEFGYKPAKIAQGFKTIRRGCLKADRTYTGSVTFSQFWDREEKAWKGWDERLSQPDSPYFDRIARQLELQIEDMIRLVEPNAKDSYTFVDKFSFSSTGNKVEVSYKTYPLVEIDAAMIVSTLNDYIKARNGEAAGFQGIVAQVSLSADYFKDFCTEKPCDSPFAACHNMKDDKMCRCNPGFVQNATVSSRCDSYCKWKQCDGATSYSCRDVAETGPQCLCKKGYALNALNNCQRQSACPKDKNVCGRHGECHDNGDGTYECVCNEGYIKAAKPAPDVCVPDVIVNRGLNASMEPPWVGIEPTKGSYKITIPVGFPFFDSKQWKLFVTPNGLISLGKNVTASEMRSLHPSTYGYMIAPFWSDFALDNLEANVHAHAYDATTMEKDAYWSTVIDELQRSIEIAQDTFPPYAMAGYPPLKEPRSFIPKTIVEVSWTDLILKPFVETDRMSMQVFIASDGVATVVMANYDASKTYMKTWENPEVELDPELTYPHRGFIGIQGGEHQYCLNSVSFGESKDDCRSFTPGQLFAPKGSSYSLPPGRFVFLVANDQYVTVESDRRCFDALRDYNQHKEAAIDMNYIYTEIFATKPDPCPWTETQVKLDSRFMKNYNDGEKSCYTKKFTTEVKYTGSEHHINTTEIRPYCCYNYNALLTQASSNSYMIVEPYAELQANVHRACCWEGGHCPLANMFAPAIFVGGYEPPVTAGLYGDPHMINFAGNEITFKGHGDYVLFSSSELLVEGRFDEFSGENAAGSGLQGVAWKVGKYAKISATLGGDNGTFIFAIDGKPVDLADMANHPLHSFNKDGHVESTLDKEGSVATVKVTYVDGLSFEIVRMPTQTWKSFYMHFRIRMPRSYLKAANTGLLGDFVLPDGTKYTPKWYGSPKVMGDEDFFYNFGRKWTVSNAKVPLLFETKMSTPNPEDYVPSEFVEKYLKEGLDKIPWPLYHNCHGMLDCWYDYYLTNQDSLVAEATYEESNVLHQRRREENEKPPTFGWNPYVWLINVNSLYAEFVPNVVDPEGVYFSYQTDFPRHLISEFDPFTGKMTILMIEEARHTFLYKGPFEFHLIAKRGSSGVSSYSPVAIRICNCNEDQSCDWSDDMDAMDVGVYPTQNNKRYGIVRCNCMSFQTGKFCDGQYNACGTQPCFPGVPCFKLQISDFKRPAFSCGMCPYGYKGDGFHCVKQDPCKDVKCDGIDDGKICLEGQCVCPPGVEVGPDGKCLFVNRCSVMPNPCPGDNQRCNQGDHHTFWCDCKPGYMPRYRKDSLNLQLQECVPITYTYVGTVSFDKHYNADHNVETYRDILEHPETMEYQAFARRILYDLDNTLSLLKTDILGVYIRDVRRIPQTNGFTIDFFAYSDIKLVTANIQSIFARYFGQTGNLGVMVSLRDPLSTLTFVDVCESQAYNPCQHNSTISTCWHNGAKGVGPLCQCNSHLGYESGKTVTGETYCVDKCEKHCKDQDEKSQCVRPDNDPAQMYTCECEPGTGLNSATKKCEPYPNPCIPNPCGREQFCVPGGAGQPHCFCYPGTVNVSGECLTPCEQAGECRAVENAYGCQSLFYGYMCLCDPGHQWNPATKTCDDIDECAEGLFTCPLHSKCVNTVGSYKCECDTGYTFSSKDKNKCYAKQEYVLYPFNFNNAPPLRETEENYPYTVRGGFHYHDNFIHTVYVGFDGFIGLDAPPPYKYYGTVLRSHLVAPFFMDLDVLPNDPLSGLYIDAFDFRDSRPAGIYEKWKSVFDLTNHHLQIAYPHSENPELWNNDTTWINDMLILTWVNVAPCPASEYGKFHATFQVVLGANSAFSFAIFNHVENPDNIKWPTALKAPQMQPLIGHTLGKTEIRFEEDNGSPPDFEQMFHDDNQMRGRHVEAFGAPVKVFNRKCLQLHENYPKEAYETLWRLNKPGSVTSQRTACPAFLNQMQLDNRWLPEYQIGDAICFGFSFWQGAQDPVTPNLTYNVRSVCCYDISSGAFLTYPHGHAHSFLQVKELQGVQMPLFETCCVNSAYCEIFAAKNPSNLISPDYYDQPEIAYIRGDPHMGLPYHQGEQHRQITFNGRGEYTLIKSRKGVDSEIQVRFATRPGVTERGTFVTGVAAKSADGYKVEVIMHDGQIHVFKNGVETDLKSITLPESHSVVTAVDYDIWYKDGSIGYVTAHGIAIHMDSVDKAYFNVRFGLPKYLANHVTQSTCGLMTSFEIEPYADCDGKQAVGDVINNDVDAYNFGQNFKLKSKANSLFSYKVGPSFETVNTVPDDWKPVFQSELIGPGTADMDKVCGTDKGCKYDYWVTENAEIAKNTMKFGEELNTLQKYSVQKRPTITNDVTKHLHIWLSELDTTFTYEIDTEEEANGTSVEHFYYLLFHNFDYEKWFHFDLITGKFTMNITKELRDNIRQMHEAPYLRFVAIHLDASSILSPPVWTCACERQEQCDKDYENRPMYERPHGPDHNYFMPCKCPPTARGRFCELPFDPCIDNPCGTETTCKRDETTITGYKCGKCPPAYLSYDGICRPRICHEDTCVNGDCYVATDGSLKCRCNLGYEPTPGNETVCRDINECQLGRHNCYKFGPGFECTNVIGSWVCGCKPGYAPDNVNEMTTCVHSPNQVMARLKANSVIYGIEDIEWDDDLLNPGSLRYQRIAKELAEKLNTWIVRDLHFDDVTSVVVRKFTKGSIVIDYAINSNSPIDLQKLLAAQTNFLKTNTIEDIKGVDLSSIKVTADPCESDTTCDRASTSCRWDPRTAVKYCDCLAGFIPNPKSDRTCDDNCTNICVGKLGRNAKCSRTSSGYTCDCIANYYEEGGLCINKCDPTNPCKNGGLCAVAPGKNFVCSCPSKYIGQTCETECMCLNGGVCGDPLVPTKCICTTGYAGDKCQDCAPGYKKDGSGKCFGVCEANTCQNGGTCAVQATGPVCICPKDYTGPTCGTKCQCENGGICGSDPVKPTKCSCPEGYTGDTCHDCAIGFKMDLNNQCIRLCSDNPCGANGACSIQNNKPICTCIAGYIGGQCDKCDTANGFELNLGKCTTKCTTAFCGEHGDCVIKNGNPACVCRDKYAGELCDLAPAKNERVVDDTDKTTMIIVACVLGAACFVFLVIIFACGCFLQKLKSRGRLHDGPEATEMRRVEPPPPVQQVSQPPPQPQPVSVASEYYQSQAPVYAPPPAEPVAPVQANIQLQPPVPMPAAKLSLDTSLPQHYAYLEDKEDF